MWTYFLILLGVLGIIAVFVHKVFYLKKMAAKKEADKAAAQAAKESAAENEEEIEEKKLKKSELEEINELCEKADIKIGVGNEDEGVKLLVQALAIDENHLPAQQKLAMLYVQKEMFAAAAALFERMAKLTDDAIHYSHLGLALFNQQDFEGAKAAYQKAVDLDPSRPQRFVSLGQVYRALGQSQNAIVAITKATEMEENEEVLRLLAEIYMEAGDDDGAKAALNKIAPGGNSESGGGA